MFLYMSFPESNFLKNSEKTAETSVFMTEMSEGSPQVPSLAKVEEAQKRLYANLASSNSKKVVAKVQSHRVSLKKKLGEDKKPCAANNRPQAQPRAGILKKSIPQPFLIITGQGKPAPLPCTDSIETKRKLSVRFSTDLQRKETSADSEKTQGTPLPICPPPPILTMSEMPLNASGLRPGAASKSSKLSSVPLKIRTYELTLPPDNSQKTTRGGQVLVNKVKDSSKSKQQLPRIREVGPEKTSSKPEEHKGKAKAAEGQSPGRTKEPKEPEAASKIAGSATIKKIEKNRVRPYSSPTRCRGLTLLKGGHLASEKTGGDVPAEGIQGRAFSRSTTEAEGTKVLESVRSPNHASAHLAHPVDIIRYRRSQLRSA